MILQLRKSCLDAIQRTLINITHIRTQYFASLPKLVQQKFNSIQNDIQLLKDNFTLIATKILRLESKCNQKQTMVHKIQNKYRNKYEEIQEAYKILEVKYQKLGKQLNFIKFSNNNLRKQIHNLQGKEVSNKKLKNGLKEIEKLIKNNGQNVQIKINKIITDIQQDQINIKIGIGDQIIFDKSLQINEIKIYDNKQKDRICKDKQSDKMQEFSIEKDPAKFEKFMKQQIKIASSCELKSERQSQRTKKKLLHPTKQSSQNNKQSMSTDKKKRNQLAKLVEQQGRLAKINQRYLSTDLI